MRAIVSFAAFAAVVTSGCLRSTAFRCQQNSDCGPSGVCESVGFCSVPNVECAASGRSYSDSAGQGLSNTCVPPGDPGPGVDAAIDAAIDGMTSVGCPSGYNQVNGSAHRYKLLTNVSWDEAKLMCDRTSTAAYLAIPDDAAELADLATVASAPFWIGIDDQVTEGTYVTQKAVPATFLPWAPGEPDDTMGGQDCVDAVSSTKIATDKCGIRENAVCECEP